MDPRPIPQSAKPYSPRTPSDREHDWYLTCAEEIADRMARAMAKGEMRLGVAHRYLAVAHIQALLDGGGPEHLVHFLNQLLSELDVIDVSESPK